MNLWNGSGLGVQQTEFDTTDAAGERKVGTGLNTKEGPRGSRRVIDQHQTKKRSIRMNISV
jgi:hypothetical protein